MASKEMTDLTAAVSEMKTVATSAAALINGLADQIDATAGDAAAAEALATDLRAQAVALGTAVTENTAVPPGA